MAFRIFSVGRVTVSLRKSENVIVMACLLKGKGLYRLTGLERNDDAAEEVAEEGVEGYRRSEHKAVI
jgi:hypothetical protein